LVVGNAIDANNNGTVDAAERSDALVVLKNGNTAIGNITPTARLDVDGQIRIRGGAPAAGRVLTSDADGTASWADASTTASGTLDQAYDFGGPGAGRTIIADAGAVRIDGVDGFVSTGTTGSGTIPMQGPGERMMWYPRKAAFRAGLVLGAQWDDVNIGVNSTAFGMGMSAGGLSMSFGRGRATGPSSASWGEMLGLGTGATAAYSTAFGYNTTASGPHALSFGSSTNASGMNATAWGSQSGAAGDYATAWGLGNTAPSYGETVLGIGATLYTPSVNGETQFRAANATDRLLVVGNAIDANNNGSVDAAERSNALVILKNGNTAIGNITPTTKLDVDGQVRIRSGAPAAGRVLTSAADGTASWQDATASAWGLNGNAITAANFLGSTNNIPLRFRVNNETAGLVTQTGALTFLGYQAGLNNTGTHNTFIGLNSGRANTTGSSNVGMGSGTLENNVTGTDNAAIGRSAGLASTGSRNAFLGRASGVQTTTASGSTFVGAWAGRNTSTGDYNTMVGDSAGFTNTVGTSNTIVGALANLNANNRNNATAIGFRARVDANNAMVLGSVSGINGATETVNVGIGTTNPTQRLHVVGSIRMVDGNQAAGRVLTSAADGTASWQDATATAWGLNGNAIAATNFLGSTNNQPVIFRTNNVERMRITNTGLVGIGIAVPAFDLTLANNSAAKPGSNTWIIASDARLKRDISPFTDGIDLIKRIDPIWYTYNGEAGMPQERFAGAIAQEIQKVAPYMVRNWTYTDERGGSSDYLAVDYGALDFVMINALKEQQNMIELLQTEMARLRAELEQLRNDR